MKACGAATPRVPSPETQRWLTGIGRVRDAEGSPAVRAFWDAVVDWIVETNNPETVFHQMIGILKREQTRREHEVSA